MIAVTLEQGFWVRDWVLCRAADNFCQEFGAMQKTGEVERSEASENERNQAPNLLFAKCTSLSKVGG
jgi:hypothetical protein